MSIIILLTTLFYQTTQWTDTEWKVHTENIAYCQNGMERFDTFTKIKVYKKRGFYTAHNEHNEYVKCQLLKK